MKLMIKLNYSYIHKKQTEFRQTNASMHEYCMLISFFFVFLFLLSFLFLLLH